MSAMLRKGTTALLGSVLSLGGLVGWTVAHRHAQPQTSQPESATYIDTGLEGILDRWLSRLNVPEVMPWHSEPFDSAATEQATLDEVMAIQKARLHSGY